MLQLFDLNHIKLHGLTNYKDLKRERTLDGEEILSFLYLQNDDKYSSIQEETYIRTKDNEYVVKEVNIDDDWTGFVAKINVENLKGNVIERFESIEQTVTDCLNLALVSTGWTIGACDVTKKRTVRMSRKSTYDIIQEARKIYRCDYKFDAINKKIYIYQSMGADKGSYFTEELNLKKLNVQSNSYDYCTRIIPIGKDGLQINDINDGKQYVENHQYSSKIITVYWEDNRYTVVESLKEDAIARLNELSKPIKSYKAEIFDLARLNDKYKNILDYNLGDTISLLSKDKKVKDKQRIVMIIEYPEEPERNTCEIANRIMSLEDLQVDFEEAADTVDAITTSDGGVDGSKVDSIEWSQLKNVSIYTADIQDMNVVFGRIGTLETTTAHITNGVIDNATIDVAKVNNLSSTYATITNLNAVNANLQTVTGDVASIKNVLAGNVGADNLAAGAIQANSAVIANGAISSAQIASLDVGKLNAGDISTTKFRIVSTSGNMLISDNTIQIKDASRVRVQIGKDASNDYNMYVWDASGNLMFDATGLKASGIKSKIIVDNMVSDTANINCSKLEKESLIVQINGATTTLKSSRVKLDTENQTLDVAFTSLKSTVTSHDSTISSQGTSISTIQGQISSKIWSTDITTAVNNVQVGSRNLIIDSGFENSDITANWIFATSSSWNVGTIYGVRDSSVHSIYSSYSCKCGNGSGLGVGIAEKKQGTSSHPVTVGQNYQIGFDVFSTDAATQYILCARCYDSGGSNISSTAPKPTSAWSYSAAYGAFCIYTTIPSVNAWNRVVYPFIATAGVSYVSFALMYYTSGTLKYIWFDNIKFEQGTKSTDWTPAPEDTQSQIDGATTRISTAESNINQLTTSISLKVDTSTFTSYKTSNDSAVSSLTSRINSAELKITDTAIVSTVRSSSAYLGDLSGKVGNSEIISKINQTAEAIKIQANKIDLTGYVTISSLSTAGSTTINGSNITTGKIKADFIQGGTLTLGGSNNTNGSILIQSSTGTTLSTLDVNGFNLNVATQTIEYKFKITSSTDSTLQMRLTPSIFRIGKWNGDTHNSGLSIYLNGVNYDEPHISNPLNGMIYFDQSTYSPNVHAAQVFADGWDAVFRGGYSDVAGRDMIGSYYGWDKNRLYINGQGQWTSGVYVKSGLFSEGTFYTDRIVGRSVRNFYVGDGSNGTRIDAGDGGLRLYTSWTGNADYGLRINSSGGIDVLINNSTKFSVSSGGSKVGGTYNLDGIDYGMSPIDSPRSLIEDVYIDIEVQEEGTTIELDVLLARMIDKYAVFVSNTKVEVISKDKNSFVVKGYTGKVDIRIIGLRKDCADQYFPIMNDLVA